MVVILQMWLKGGGTVKRYNENTGDLAVMAIEKEIESYSKCITFRAIMNHFHYVSGMIRLAASINLVESNICIMLHQNNELMKTRTLDIKGVKYGPSKTKPVSS